MIDTLFPTCILRDYDVIENYQNLCDHIKLDSRHSNPHIHETEKFKPLAEKVLELSYRYANHMKWDCELYISSMWYNVMNQYEDHRPHTHGNSLLSGVYYPSADPQHPPIEFFNNKRVVISPTTSEWNIFNSDSWQYPVVANSILIFPADLEHWVSVNKSPNPRLSISFNVMIKGEAGKKEDLTSVVWK